MALRLPSLASLTTPYARTAYAPRTYNAGPSASAVSAAPASAPVGSVFRPASFAAADPVARFTRNFAAPDSGLGALGSFGSFGQFPGFGQFAGAVGQATPTGPSFAGGNLDDASGDINAAASRWGVPANFLKAIIAAESSGDWNANNRVAYLRGSSMLPYIGVFEEAARSRTGRSIDSVIGNRAGQIDMLAQVLRSQYDEIRQQNPGYDWYNVASYHYSGRPDPVNQPWADEAGNGSNLAYANKIRSWWQMLDGMAGGAGNYGSLTGGGGSFDSIWGGQSFPITQEMGLNEFSRQHLGGMYSYATAYGVTGHAGLDVGMPTGTQLHIPVGGTVTVAGGSGFYTDDRFGGGPGVGELRIRLDNGDELILGHMERIFLQPGQRVSPGMLAGLSGTANGPHVHVEYRKYTPGATASGYTAVDPRQALGGMGGVGMGVGNMFQSAAQGAMNQMQGMNPSFRTTADFARFLWNRR